MKKAIFPLTLFLFAAAISVNARLGEPVKQIETIRGPMSRIFVFTLSNEGDVSYVRQESVTHDFCRSVTLNMTLDNKAADSYKKLTVLKFKQITLSLTPEGAIVVFGSYEPYNGLSDIYYTTQDLNNIDSWVGWKLLPNSKGFSQITGWKDRSQSIAGLKNIGLSVSFNYMKVTSLRQVEGSRQWSGWKDLDGHNLKQIACGISKTKKYVFGLSNDGAVYYTSGTQDAWSGWSNLEGLDLKKIEVGSMSDGRLILFAIGGDNDTYERHQVTPDGGWSDWSTLLGSNNFKGISCTISKAGRVTLFGLHFDGSVDFIAQTNPETDAWSPWSPLYGSEIQSIESYSNWEGRMLISSIGGDGKVYNRWQAAPDGSWKEWDNLSDIFSSADNICNSVTLLAFGNANSIPVPDKKYPYLPPTTTTDAPTTPPNQTVPPAPVNPPATVNPPVTACSYSQGYWFANSDHPWPDLNGAEEGNITVGGYNYSEAEGRSIWNSSNASGISESKKAFLSVCTIKLSVVPPAANVWTYVNALENWLKSLTKLTPANLPAGATSIKKSCSKLEQWISTNHCQ